MFVGFFFRFSVIVSTNQHCFSYLKYSIAILLLLFALNGSYIGKLSHRIYTFVYNIERLLLLHTDFVLKVRNRSSGTKGIILLLH